MLLLALLLLPLSAGRIAPEQGGIVARPIPVVRELIVVPEPATFRSFGDVMVDVLRRAH